ncbi:MAG: hypothetical protein EXS17_07600 [Phycisphaerales bacterium]|nr:hypothetical protein [Phycisphaerales bacterium]
MARTLILSDLHFGLPEVPCGRPPRTPATLAALLNEADHLILNGDIADIHHQHRGAHGMTLLDEWLGMVARAGIEVTRINGNHDFDPAQPDFVDLFAGAFFVTHGHAFGKSMLPWTTAHRVVSESLSAARARNPKTLEGDLAAAGEAAMAQWGEAISHSEPTALVSIGMNPWRVARVLAWWRQFPREAAAYADRFRPNAQVVVCGHSHRAGAWSIASSAGATRRRILNTGGFTFPSSPHAVLIDDSARELRVSLRAIRARRGRYQLAAECPASCWRIQRPASARA